MIDISQDTLVGQRVVVRLPGASTDAPLDTPGVVRSVHAFGVEVRLDQPATIDGVEWPVVSVPPEDAELA